MTKKLEGKVALVTGGGSGIGRAAALAFAREGATVAVADRVLESGEETACMIRDSGRESLFIPCDVSKTEEVKTMVAKTTEQFGRLNYAFNNAGIEGAMNPIVEYPEDDFRRVLSVNLTGLWLCMKYEIPHMLKEGGGAIVNNASVAGLIGAPGMSAYSASKHGVVGLTKTVALEYAKNNIRVNAVCPGVINTSMNDRFVAAHPEMEELFLNAHPVGRIGEVAEVAEAVIWLCSDAASFVTGHAMAIDGGCTAQ